MEVPPVGLGSPNIPATLKPAGIQGPMAAAIASAGRSVVSADNVATLLELLALPDIAELFATVDQRIAPANLASTEPLLTQARSAIAVNDIPLALSKIKELIAADPQRAAMLASDPSLETIRNEIQNIVRVLTAQARTDAEDKLGIAAQAIAISGPRRIPNTQTDSPAVLSVATHLFESGQLLNYLRSAELGQIVIALYAPVTASAAVKKAPRTDRDMISRLGMFWKRAPLLVLFAGWFAAGLIAAVFMLAFGGLRPQLEIWGLGFLALVGFGFYVRIRNVRL